jgi:hypothetical protein
MGDGLLPVHLSGGLGAASGVLVTHPLDVLKTRAQLRRDSTRESLPRLALRVARSDGIFGFWGGLIPALGRALTYGALRIGLYQTWRPREGVSGTSTSAEQLRTSLTRFSVGCAAGATAAAICNPLDVLKVRLVGGQGHSVRSSKNRALPVIRSIFAQDGFGGFWRGTQAAVVRSALLTAGQLATYDEAKRLVCRSFGLGDGWRTQVSAAWLSGLVTTTICSPADVIKTRLQGAGAQQLYGGSVFRCFTTTVRMEGPRGLFKGWSASYLRQGPQTFVILIVMEQIRRACGHAPV